MAQFKVCNTEQSAIQESFYTGGMDTDQFDNLQRDYDETKKKLAHPLDFDDLEQLREHRERIFREARALALSLNIPAPQWLDNER